MSFLELEEEEELKNARKEAERIFRRCERKTIYFIDEEFPAAPESLYFNPTERSKEIRWQRPDEMVFDEYSIFRQPSLSDVKQRGLGNCWFLAVLAVLAQRPELIERLFVAKEYCSRRVFLIRLYIDGKWTTVVIDDLLPYDHNGNPLYSKPEGKQLWVPLLEKAAAKIFGCYEALDGGYESTAFSILTGAPCKDIDFGRLDEIIKTYEFKIWTRLCSIFASNHLVATGTGRGTISEEEYRKKGLHSPHAYSVLKVVQIGEYRLLKIRDPAGIDTWCGDWSNKSNLWTNTLRQQLSYNSTPNGSDEGVFWISFEDFLKYFSSVTYCKVGTEWNERRLKIPLKSCVRIKVDDKTLTQFTLHQKNFFDRKNNNSILSELNLHIFSSKSKEYPIIDRLVTRNKGFKSLCLEPFITCEHHLRKGLYLVSCTSLDYDRNGVKKPIDESDCILAIHSLKPIHIVSGPESPNFLLADSLISVILTEGTRYELDNKMAWYRLYNGSIGVIYVAENGNKTEMMKVSLTLDSTSEIEIYSARGALSTQDFVPAFHRQIINIFDHPDLNVSIEDWSANIQCVHINGTTNMPNVPSTGAVNLFKPRPIL